MNSLKKYLCLILVLILILPGCSRNTPAGGKETEQSVTETAASAETETQPETERETETAAETEKETETETQPVQITYLDGIIGEGKPLENASAGAVSDDEKGVYEVVAEAYVPAPDIMPGPGWRPGPEPQAGLLTAREWSDSRNAEEFLKYLAGQDIQSILSARKIAADGILRISGLPGLNRLVLKDKDGKVLAQAVSDVYGKAVLLFDRKAGKELSLMIDDEEEMAFQVKGQITDLSFDGHVRDQKADKLDLMLMVDTTGSMGDELEYLKKELANVVESVYKLNPGMSIRVSVNFYRDEGDEYVVKYYDFRDDVQDAVALIASQYSAGGGDYPEAVHTALDNAIFGHAWREDAVKLCYLVLDAPPHREGDYVEVDEQTRVRVENIDGTLEKAVDGAAEKGIRIIPVVASGAESEVEVLCRYWAFRTGGTYIYLTNDSGIGLYHETPDVPETKLEYLNDCLIRVTSEYCGLHYESQREPEPSSWDYPTEPTIWWETDQPIYEMPVEPTVHEVETAAP
ncbi:MAG: VWA domain-containing protein [Lachnospiraceae bacterium]|nr:VWA domain-containing protein [Lachnospiraceae bacterium]